MTGAPKRRWKASLDQVWRFAVESSPTAVKIRAYSPSAATFLLARQAREESMKRVLVAVLLAVPLGVSTASADVVTDWNVTALGVAASTSPQGTNRVMAITRAAIFDA